MVVNTRRGVSESGSVTRKTRVSASLGATSFLLGGLKSLQNVFNQGKGKKGENSRKSAASSVPVSSQPPPESLSAPSSSQRSHLPAGPVAAPALGVLSSPSAGAESNRLAVAAGDGDRECQTKALNLEREVADVLSIGQEVRVTSDERHLEQCVIGVGMQWPTGPSGRPWSRKLGLSGKVMQVDYGDFTVELDDSKGWVPIKALVGFESWSIAEESESEEDLQQPEPQQLQEEPAKQKPQETAPQPVFEISSPSKLIEQIQPAVSASRKTSETLPSPKVSATPKKRSSRSRGSGCTADDAIQQDPKEQIDPEVTPEVTGPDQPKRTSKKGTRLSSHSGKLRISSQTSPTEAASLKRRSSSMSILSIAESDGEPAVFTPPQRIIKPRSKVKVKRKVLASPQAESAPGEMPQITAAAAEEPTDMMDTSTLTADVLQERYGRSPSKVEPSVLMNRMSMAVAIDSDSDDSMEGTIYVSTTENGLTGDGALNSRRSSLLSGDSNARLLAEAPQFEETAENEPAATTPADGRPGLASLQSPMQPVPIAGSERKSSRSSACRPPPQPAPTADSGRKASRSPVARMQRMTTPESERKGSLGSLLSELEEPGSLEKSVPATPACSSFWSSPENSETEEGDQVSLQAEQRWPASLDDFYDDSAQAERMGAAESLTITLQSPTGSNQTVLLQTALPQRVSLSTVMESAIPAGFMSGDAAIQDELLICKAEDRAAEEAPRRNPRNLLALPRPTTTDAASLMGDSEPEEDVAEDFFQVADAAPSSVSNSTGAAPASKEAPTAARASEEALKTQDLPKSQDVHQLTAPPAAATSSNPIGRSSTLSCDPARRSSTRSSRRFSKMGPTMSRHINWRTSRVHSVCESNILSEALQKVADKDRAMNPVRAQSGLSLLNRMKNLLERQDFDDTAGIKTIENIFFDSIPRKHVEIRSIEQVLRIDLLKRFLRKVTDDFASIEATFHGTREEYVKDILDVGLNPSLCATGAYGRGAYVGTHAGVAHQYADPNEEGWRHMLVILVIVGSSVVKGREGEQCPSTALDSLVNPTQYCFVEEDRLYCSHLITYRVLDLSKRRTGGGFEDPFQRKLTCAVTKAAKLRNKAGLR